MFMAVNIIETWAKSVNQHSISLAYSKNFVFEKKLRPILFIGGVHGDEPEGVELAKSLLNFVQQSKADYVPFLLIPCLNPDGYLAKTRTNANGVDLNRNYPASNWSPRCEKERYFPGQEPASEPEIQALVKLIQSEKPRLIVHFHSWQPCIVYTGDLGLKDAKRLSQVSGYDLKDDIGYPTTGSLSSYGWEDYKIPIICVEEQEGCALHTIWPRFQPALEEILNDKSERQ